jgi:diadenosine tetraphosphate (Ap4A) HIT family hydrolase
MDGPSVGLWVPGTAMSEEQMFERTHHPTRFDMTTEEKTEIQSLLDRAQSKIAVDHSPDGYNIGVNIGRAAGQNRLHVHVHLIPRYRGDVVDPSGGIRCVLSGK